MRERVGSLCDVAWMLKKILRQRIATDKLQLPHMSDTPRRCHICTRTRPPPPVCRYPYPPLPTKLEQKSGWGWIRGRILKRKKNRNGEVGGGNYVRTSTLGILMFLQWPTVLSTIFFYFRERVYFCFLFLCDSRRKRGPNRGICDLKGIHSFCFIYNDDKRVQNGRLHTHRKTWTGGGGRETSQWIV